jgi:glycosyltransferase involved in cell wall biosynthesis
MASISVVIATFGAPSWGHLAIDRALPSVQAQTVAPVSVNVVHGASLHEARNQGAADATGEWLCFLDADDELAPTYVEEMDEAITAFHPDDALLQPATIGIVDGLHDPVPTVIPAKPLIDGNFMVIGTLIRTEQFLRIGGFRPWPCYEDWDLFLRAWIDGADLIAVPAAVYQVHVSEQSRNNCDRSVQEHTYRSIRSQHLNAAVERGRRPRRRF